LPWDLLQNVVCVFSIFNAGASVCGCISCRLSFAARSCCQPCCLDQTRRPTLFAQEIRPNPRWLMTRSSLRCHTSIIQSSTLVQASSSLSMGHTRAGPRSLPITEKYFRHFLREFCNHLGNSQLSLITILTSQPSQIPTTLTSPRVLHTFFSTMGMGTKLQTEVDNKVGEGVQKYST